MRRINLDGNLNSNINILRACVLQNQLYIKPIWGCYNLFGIKVSKLILNLRILFPIKTEDLSVEFITIETLNLSQIMSEFIFEFKVIYYSMFKGVININWFTDIKFPLFRLPKFLGHDVIDVNGIYKVLISQFMKPQEVKISDNCISLLTLNADYLHIRIDKFEPNIEYHKRTSKYASLMFNLGIKNTSIFKNFVNAMRIVYYKNKWYIYGYNSSLLYKVIYGFKRVVRYKKIIISPFLNHKCVVLSVVISKIGNKVINIGDVINLNLIIALYYSNVLYVSSSIIKSLIIVSKNNKNNKNNDNITVTDIKSIDLAQVGRHIINNLTHSYFYSSDLLTKRDLIIIYYKIINFELNIKKINTNVRILRSIGNTIIEIVSMFFKTLRLIEMVKEYLLNETFVVCDQLQVEIDKLFTTSNLCQYSEQLNSLSSLSHRNKLSCIDTTKVSPQTAEISIRDVHQWYFGKICPIESPEGQAVGLVVALSLYANIDVNGYILTAYHKVRYGRISNDIVYLNSYEEEKYCISLSNNICFDNDISCLSDNKFKIIKRKEAALCIISPIQVFSCVVNLIPFLSHNDPTRALMAANMQKQAIPLAIPQAPLIGSGLEYDIMKNTYHNIIARKMSIVISVDTIKIVVYEITLNKYKVYLLPQPSKSNQGTCLKLRPVVYPCQIVHYGDVLAECQSSDNGEMSLGANILVAFMCWEGFNYEDSILVSSSVVEKGTLDSLHIMDLEVKVLKTLFGIELLTNELESVLPKHYKYLPKNGIVAIGSFVREGDVLVGKLSPVVNNFINEINGNRDQFKTHMIDSSLKVPEGISSAFVIHTSRETQILGDDGSYNVYIFNYNIITKSYIRRCGVLLKFNEIVNFKHNCEHVSSILLNKDVKYALDLVYKCYISHLKKLQQFLFKGFNLRLTNDKDFNDRILEVIKVKLLVRKSIRVGDKISGRYGNKGVISKIIPKEDMPFMADGTPIDIVLNPLSVPSRMNLGQILEANLGLISYKFGMEFKYILEMYGYYKDMEFMFKIATSKFLEIYPNICVYSNDIVIKILQELSKGVKISCPLLGFPSSVLIRKLSRRLSFKDYNGQYQLYDGRTGLPFNRKSMVGIMYIYKLNHLVDDKLCTRSTGPYSVVTQQPLKGRANKGGQRLGEMEIWTLQSYGAAYNIKEVLMAKCDDIASRKILKRGLLRGLPLLTTFWGEGLLLLFKELFAMCINVEFK